MSTATSNPYVDPVLMKGLKEFDPSTNKAFVSTHKVSKSSSNVSNLGSDEKELEVEAEPAQETETSAAPSDKVDYQLFDEESFAVEMDEALANIRKLGKFHQAELVNSIVADFYDFNGIEPSVNDILAIFARIKSVFAVEAAEDEEDYQKELADAQDSDYDETNWQDEAQFLADLEEDFSHLDSNSEDDASGDNDDFDAIQEQEANKENQEIIANLQ